MSKRIFFKKSAPYDPQNPTLTGGNPENLLDSEPAINPEQEVLHIGASGDNYYEVLLGTKSNPIAEKIKKLAGGILLKDGSVITAPNSGVGGEVTVELQSSTSLADIIKTTASWEGGTKIVEFTGDSRRLNLNISGVSGTVVKVKFISEDKLGNKYDSGFFDYTITENNPPTISSAIITGVPSTLASDSTNIVMGGASDADGDLVTYKVISSDTNVISFNKYSDISDNEAITMTSNAVSTDTDVVVSFYAVDTNAAESLIETFTVTAKALEPFERLTVAKEVAVTTLPEDSVIWAETVGTKRLVALIKNDVADARYRFEFWDIEASLEIKHVKTINIDESEPQWGENSFKRWRGDATNTVYAPQWVVEVPTSIISNSSAFISGSTLYMGLVTQHSARWIYGTTSTGHAGVYTGVFKILWDLDISNITSSNPTLKLVTKNGISNNDSYEYDLGRANRRIYGTGYIDAKAFTPFIYKGKLNRPYYRLNRYRDNSNTHISYRADVSSAYAQEQNNETRPNRYTINALDDSGSFLVSSYKNENQKVIQLFNGGVGHTYNTNYPVIGMYSDSGFVFLFMSNETLIVKPTDLNKITQSQFISRINNTGEGSFKKIGNLVCFNNGSTRILDLTDHQNLKQITSHNTGWGGVIQNNKIVGIKKIGDELKGVIYNG